MLKHTKRLEYINSEFLRRTLCCHVCYRSVAFIPIEAEMVEGQDCLIYYDGSYGENAQLPT